MTAPTCFLSHVERVAACRAMFMKYVCQSTRSDMNANHLAEAGKAQGRDASTGSTGRSADELVLAPAGVLDLVLRDLVVHHTGRDAQELRRVLLDAVADAQPLQE